MPIRSFITTPIFYVNAAPHIGHLYTAVLADVAHKWNCMVGGASGCVLSTGTDEHGIKIQQAAAARGCTPQELCNQISGRFRDLFNEGSISHTHFIRTTSNHHKSVVQNIWTSLHDKGWIYKGGYEGWYSVPDETFLSESQVTDGDTLGSKVSIDTGHSLEWSSEENYMFKLSALKDQLLEWLNSTPYPVYPELYRRQVIHWLRTEPLNDLSISRPVTRLKWGIPVPGDESQMIYVWLDALINYLTVSGYPGNDHCWPATAHIVGKDILRFHAIYWPAFLMAAGLELPRRIIGHAHWTVSKSKMSKSKGNVVNPFDSLKKYGVEPLRYYLMKESSLDQDGDYCDDRVAGSIDADLADTLGNLTQRVTSKKLHPVSNTVKLHPQYFPFNKDSHVWDNNDRDLLESLTQLPRVVQGYYDNYEFGKGINYIMKNLHKTNSYIDRHKPWTLVSDPDKRDYAQTILAVCVEGLRISSTYLRPIIPGSCDEILRRLGGSGEQLASQQLQCWLDEDNMKRCEQTVILGGTPVFTKIKSK